MLSQGDRALLFKLIEKLTGASKTDSSRLETLVVNVERRMAELKISDIISYLRLVESSSDEYTNLVSLITIHTTSWFRESPHFVAFQEILLKAVTKREVFKVWCAACSTGAEVYSFALMLEEFRKVHPHFDYRILGTDIDSLSLRVAERAIYEKKDMNFHVQRYSAHVLEGSGPTEGFFTLSKEIRNRCTFIKHDLRSTQSPPNGPFHLIVCRNVLIYFNSETTALVVSNLVRHLREDGHLMLGHSESIKHTDCGLVQRGHSIFGRPEAKSGESERQKGRYRILCMDESPTMRSFFSKIFTGMGFDTVVVGSVSEGANHLNFSEVDLVTMDLNWPAVEKRDGFRAPVVIVGDAHSSQAADVVALLAKGAQDYIERNQLRDNPEQVREKFLQLIERHRNTVRKESLSGEYPKSCPDAILIGASTGGPQALVQLLEKMPQESPPVLITQHISPKFARPLAERIAETSGLKIGEVTNGAPLLPGHLYMSYGDYHIGPGEEGGRLILLTSDSPPFNGHRPSVDFLFNSALGLKSNFMAILLTGMGRDGSLGMRFLHKEGVFCIAQSERDCVVYGMPRDVIDRGTVNFVGTIDEIRQALLHALSLRSRNLRSA